MKQHRSRFGSALLAPLLLFLGSASLAAQSLDLARIEQQLRADSFRIIDWRGSRAPNDRTNRVALQFDDTTLIAAKWANAPRGGAAFNNEPRYEVAAYVFQRMFLPQEEYVVPPTVLRAFSLALVQTHDRYASPTFGDHASVLVVLQYWLPAVTPEGFWDEQRAAEDSVYARHIGNFNIVTHLIRHSDANVGNYLISQVEAEPRVWSVDNGVAFRSDPSNRGVEWRNLRVKRLPAATIERLRGITRADLDAALGVLFEAEVRDGRLVEVPPGENLGAGRGVRQSRGRIQLGLTSAEIGDIERRLNNLLRSVDRGNIPTF